MQSQAENAQAVSYQHANGEMFEANNLEVARGMCPVLGKLSLQEAGLLLELEAMGKEQAADQQNTPQEKPVITKIERAENRQDESEKVTKAVPGAALVRTVPEAELLSQEIAVPTVQDMRDVNTREPVDTQIREALIVQAEMARAADDTSKKFEEPVKAFVEETAVATDLPPTKFVESERHPVAEDTVEVTALINEIQKTEELEPRTTEYFDELPREAPVESPEEHFKAEQHVVDIEEVRAAGLIEEETPHETATIQQPAFAEVEPSEADQPEAHSITGAAELPAPVVEIETAITQLVAATEEAGGEEPKKIDAILEEIITLPAKFELAVDQKTEALDEKLEELFVELFEEADINYSPELVESFVRLTKAHYLEELLDVTEHTAGTAQGLPDEIGTREFLQKLQHGLSAIEQAVINFCAIGKSVLRLYNFELAHVQAIA